jgi:hypothetical protein
MRVWHIIGDVHGHIEQLRALLTALDWRPDPHDSYNWLPPEGAMLISVGDLVDRGPDSLGCLLTFKRLQAAGHAEVVLGNHECRFRQMLAHLLGEAPGLPRVPESRMIAYLQLLGLSPTAQRGLADWLDARPPWLELPGAIVAHAAWSNQVRSQPRPAQIEYCAFGRSVSALTRAGAATPSRGAGLMTLETHHALASRVGWAARWRGPQTLFWGHQVVVPGAVTRVGHTVNVESGCYQGHALSAYVHPTGEVVQVPGTGCAWRGLLAPLLPAQGVVFPMTLGDVRRVIDRESLMDVDDYLAWLELECEAVGVPLLSPVIEAAHRALYLRARSAQGSP